MKFARALAWSLLAAGLSRPCAAQFVNRAVWLGVDEEQIRTNYRRGDEYYLDRLSYVVLPPWWERGLPRFENRAYYNIGSVSTSAFSIEGGLDQKIDLDDDWSFRWHVLQGENRDARFLRNAVTLEYALGAETAVFLQADMLQDKSLIDASVGAWLWRRPDQALRLMVTAVDLPSEKGERVVYDRDAFALMLAGVFGDPAGHRVAFELGGQLPFELRDLDAATSIELQRWIGTVDTHLRLGERDWLVGRAEVEWTDKSLAPGLGSTAFAEDFRRDFRQLRLEWWRDVEATPWSIGVVHTWLGEDGVVPTDPGNGLHGRREEWFGIGRLHLPVTDRLSFEPQVFAGNVRRIERDATHDQYADRFEGKVAWNTRWDFSPNASLAALVTVQLDELAFGGGGVQFVARF